MNKANLEPLKQTFIRFYMQQKGQSNHSQQYTLFAMLYASSNLIKSVRQICIGTR